MYKFGLENENLQGRVFTVVEFARVDEGSETRFYRQCDALFPQTLQSFIGHKAFVALSMTIHGLKVFVIKRVDNTSEVATSQFVFKL